MKSILYPCLALVSISSSLSYGINSPRAEQAEKIGVIKTATEEEECTRDWAMLLGAAHLGGYVGGTLFRALFGASTVISAIFTLTGHPLNRLGDIPTNTFLLTLGCGTATYALHKLTNMFLRRSRKRFAEAFQAESQYVKEK